MTQCNGKRKEALSKYLPPRSSYFSSCNNKPESTRPALTDNSIKERYETYPKVVHAISRVIHLIGKQGIALCRQREELDDSKPANNPGIFLSILTEVVHYHPVLQEHLEEPFREDVIYVSPTSQNEMIDIGKNIILAIFVDGVEKAGMHSISADEVTSSNGEILSICMRYLDDFQNSCEVFIGVLNLERITGEHIGEPILKFYHELGLDVKECKRQSYDGTCSRRKKVLLVLVYEKPPLLLLRPQSSTCSIL